MRTMYRCYDGDASMIEVFDSLEEARAFMQRRGLRYFDWAWCDDDQVREYYIPDDEDEEDYEDDDGAYMPSITPVLVEGEEEDDEEEDDDGEEFADSIYVDAKGGGQIKLDFVRKCVDDDGESTGEGVYVYNSDGGREYYYVIADESYKCYYAGDVDPGIEQVADGITDNIWINHSVQGVLDKSVNADDYNAVVRGYAASYGIKGGIDEGFVEAVMREVEEWLVSRDDCFAKDRRGRWVWRDSGGEEE